MTPIQEIKELVALGENIAGTAQGGEIQDLYDVKAHKALALWGSDGDLLAIFEGDWKGSEEFDAKFFIAAANARPALEALLQEVERLENHAEYNDGIRGNLSKACGDLAKANDRIAALESQLAKKDALLDEAQIMIERLADTCQSSKLADMGYAVADRIQKERSE